MKLVIAIMIATTATAWAKCPHTVVGRDRCARFGEWSVRHVPLNDTEELGVAVLALAPPALGAGASSPRIVGTGVRLRVLRSVGEYATLGLEILPGTLVTTARGTATLDGMPAATSVGSIGNGLLFAGVHTPGIVQLGLELAGGFRSKSEFLTVPGTTIGASGSWFGLALDARAQVRWWATRNITVTASAGTDLLELGDLVFGIDVALHSFAYDGR